jgi:hypothetical protein
MAQSLGQGTANTTVQEDPIQTLEKLHGLVAKGVISQAEFDTKKAEILKKISG